MTRTDTLSPSSVTGLDPQSHAKVTIKIGHVTLDIPRNVLAGMFVNPLYCPSGRGVCGKVFAPQFAFLYPGMIPIPEGRVAEFRVLSPARHPDLIYAVLVGQDEPERVAAFLKGLKADDLAKGPYELYKFPKVPSILVGFPAQSEKLAISLPILGELDTTTQCNASKYLFGDINFSFQFNSTLLSHWADINRRLSEIIESFVRR